MSGEWWSIMTVAGPILLGVVLLWAVLNNRQSPKDKARSEQGASDLRDEIEQDAKDRHQS